MVNLLVASLLFLCLVNQVSALPWDSPKTETWYPQSQTHTVNTVLGYQFAEIQGNQSTYVEQDWAGNNIVYWSWKIWVVHSDGSETALSTGYVANTSRSTNGEGLQTATWTPPETDVTYGSDALKFIVYMRVNGTGFDAEAVFISDTLQTSKILNTTWTFRTYTKREYVTTTRGWIYWGDITYQTRIEGIQQKQLNPWEMQMYHIRNGDFIQFLLIPWVYFIKELFYGIIVMFIGVTTYLRYNDPRPVAVMFWIFGGTGGILSLMIPAIGLHLSWFFLSLALALTFYVLIK